MYYCFLALFILVHCTTQAFQKYIFIYFIQYYKLLHFKQYECNEELKLKQILPNYNYFIKFVLFNFYCDYKSYKQFYKFIYINRNQLIYFVLFILVFIYHVSFTVNNKYNQNSKPNLYKCQMEPKFVKLHFLLSHSMITLLKIFVLLCMNYGFQ